MRPCPSCGSRSRNCPCRLEAQFEGAVVADGEDEGAEEVLDDLPEGYVPASEREWSPEAAELRDVETSDVNAHTQGNLAQITQAEEAGLLDEDEAEAARERIREGDGEEGGS